MVMVGRFLKFAKYLRAQHFWRKATFSEISALYTAKVLRLLALNLVSAFILVYMLRSGYSLLYVAIFTAYRALATVLITPLAAMLTSKFGAKVIIAISNILYIPAFLCYLDLGNETMIAIGGFLQSVTITLYQVAHDVIFSEVKSEDNAGKEIGYMAIFEKVTSVLSPLISGVLSVILSPTTVIGLASVLFVFSTFPLFKTQETAKKQHMFNLDSVPLRNYWREMLCQIGPGFDAIVDKVWPIFLVLVVFASQDAYMITGVASSLGGLVAMVAAFFIGKLLDRGEKYGRRVFTISSFLSAAGHFTKGLVYTPIGVIVNVIFAGSAVTTKDITSLKAQFARADQSGSRVVYLMYRHLFWNIFSTLAAILWVFLMWQGDAIANLRLFFWIAGIGAAFYGLAGYWSKGRV